MTRRRRFAPERAAILDTDSSLPPLLFLAASLLGFAWVSVVAGVRRRPSSTLAMLARTPGLGIALLLAGAAAGVGVSGVALGAALTPGWPVFLQIPAAIVAVVLALAGVHAAADRLAARFPELARRLATSRLDNSRLDNIRPDNSRAAGSSRAGGGNGAMAGNGEGRSGNGWPGNGGNGEHSAAGYHDGDYSEPPPLTPAELLNLDNNDIDMVRSISRMDDRDVKDIMAPRLDVDAVSADAALPEVVRAFVSTRHTRLPVFRGTMDEVVGIVHVSDALRALAGVVGAGEEGAADPSDPDTAAGGDVITLADIMREPEFVAENMAVDALLHLMRRKSLQMAIVVDEFGGVEGIVTLEDVLEEIVGEIEDEFADEEEDWLEPEGAGVWLASPALPVEEAVRALGATADWGDVNTIGGYVYTRLGRMPAVGDVVEDGEVSIKVTQVRGRRIQQLELRRGAG